MRETPACDTYNTPENTLMECVRILAPLARVFAQTAVVSGKLFSGAGEGIRTPDPLITNQMLYRLSYASNGKIASRKTQFFP